MREKVLDNGKNPPTSHFNPCPDCIVYSAVIYLVAPERTKCSGNPPEAISAVRQCITICR
jgi:hypothetical protein